MSGNELEDVIEADLASITGTKQLLDTLLRVDAGKILSVHEVAAVGTYLNNIYSGIENVLMQFLRFHGIAKPEGDAWHGRLLDLSIANQAGPLPTLFEDISKEQVRLLKGFRHVFRSHYAIELDWTKLLPLVNGLDVWLSMWSTAVRTAVEQRLTA